MVRKILYLFTTFFVGLLIYLIFDFVKFNTNETLTAHNKGLESTEILKKQVSTDLNAVIEAAMDFSRVLKSSNITSKETLENLIEIKSKELPHILGITVAYKPYGWNEETKLYAPYHDKNKQNTTEVNKSYDYTDCSLKTALWYTGVLHKGAHWVEPYYGQVAKTLIADYSVPFYYNNDKKQFRGVVTYTISLKGFTEMIHSLSIGKIGFGFVCSEKGNILAHPISEYIGFKNIKSLIQNTTNNSLKTAYSDMLLGKSGSVNYKDKDQNIDALFFYDNVPSSNWKIGVQFLKDDLINNSKERKRKYIHISITLSIVFLLILALFYSRDFLSTKEIWYLSFFSTAILLGNIFWIGYLQHNKTKTTSENQSPSISNNSSLSSFINSQHRKLKQLKRPITKIVPFGIYIDRLDFEDSYNVNISGNVWLKYSNQIKDSVVIGFKFPQTAPFAESSLITETYRHQTKDHLLVGYNFRTTFHLNFNYEDYPFNKKNINIEILPKKVIDNVLLVPDLDSYSYTNPSKKSGVNSKINVPGSRILESYFNYSFFTYPTNFGHENKVVFDHTPLLVFNINVREVLITSFVTYLIPIFVTLVMIFIFIYATPRAKDKKIDGNAIVQGMTAFFFVLVFSHIDLRKNIQTADLIYMEYFYFITYFIIILSTYNLITFSRIPHKIFDYKENLIVKATFWPLFLLMTLILTLSKFY